MKYINFLVAGGALRFPRSSSSTETNKNVRNCFEELYALPEARAILAKHGIVLVDRYYGRPIVPQEPRDVYLGSHSEQVYGDAVAQRGNPSSK